MITTIILMFLGIGLFVASLGYVLKKVGVPTSLSYTYYLLQPYKKSWMFQITLVCVGFFLIPAWIKVSPDWCMFMAFLACASIIFVGAAAKYLHFNERYIHKIAAAIAAVASVCWSVFAYKYLWIAPLVCGVAGGIVAIIDRKDYVFWMEMAAFLSTFVSLITALFLV